MSNSAAEILYTKIMAARFTLAQREYIVSLLAINKPWTTIQDKFETRYDRRPSRPAIASLRKRYKVKIDRAQDALLATHDVIGANLINQDSYKLLDRKIKRALWTDSEIEKYRQQLLADEITQSEFDAKVAKYEAMTTNELIKLSDITHNHAHKNNEEAALTPADQAALKLLIEGIQAGNPMTLVQVLNPNVKNQVHQPDMAQPV